jgi:hypothetical protein
MLNLLPTFTNRTRPPAEPDSMSFRREDHEISSTPVATARRDVVDVTFSIRSQPLVMQAAVTTTM